MDKLKELSERYETDRFLVMPSGQTIEYYFDLLDDAGAIMNNENVASGVLAVQEYSRENTEIRHFEISTSNVRNGNTKAVNGTFYFD